AVAMARNHMMIAEAADTLLRPRIAMSGFDASAIEQACNLAIWHQSGKLAHECDRVIGDAWIGSAGRIQPLFHPQLSMVATLPVQDGMDDRSFPANDDLR